MPNARYGYVLATDEAGRVVWSSINDNNILPSQSGNIGLFLSTNGSGVYWADTSAGNDIIISAVSNNQTYYPVFASGSGVLTQAHIKSSFYPLSFNPSQNRLSVENSTINTLTIGSGNVSPVGVLQWDDGEGTASLGLKGGNTTLNLGQQNVVLSYNGVGSTLSKGQVVYTSGAQGQRPKLNLAQANNELTAARTLGLASETITAGAEGFVTTFGIVRGLNTSSITAGSGIWLSSSTPGGITMDRPVAPDHGVFLGVCVRSHASAGELFITVQNGPELDELHNVLIASVASGQTLIYDSSNSVWKNRTLNLASLNDTNITSPASGQVLTYDSSNAKWRNAASNGTTYTAGSGLILEGSQFRVHGTGELSELRLRSGSNYTGLRASGLTSNLTFTLPSGYGSSTQVLTSDGLGVLYWTTPAGTTYTAGSGLTLVGSQFHLAGTGVLNKLTVNNQQSSNVPLVSKGAAAQSANLFEAQNVSGSNLAYIDKDGDIFSVGSGTFEFVQLNSSLAARSGILYLDNNKLLTTAPNVLFTNSNLASPKVIFRASGSVTPDISLNILTTASGSTSGVQTLSFEGSAGQLFSISDVLGSGTIFSVNDISGLPLIEADASGFIRLARFGADVEVYKQLELIPTGTTSGQTNELRFFELAASGQNYVGFKAPDSLAANRIWTLPTGDGSSNQLLTTNGAGVLSWSTPVPTSGTATALNTTAVSTNATFYPVLSSGAGGSFAASIDTGLTYNPSTDMLTASGITANRIVGSTSIIITESTTSRTLQAGDNGGVIMCTNTSGATITVPTSLPVGFSVGILAAATGVVSFTTSGTTLNNRQSHTKLAGQWAMGTVIQRTTNNFVLAGDTV